MFIQTEATGNPESLRFLPGREVLAKGTLDIPDKSRAGHSPLAKRLFAVEGVSALQLDTDSITVTKNGGDWKTLKPALLGVIMDHFMSGDPVVDESAPSVEGAAGSDPLAAKILEALHAVIDPELGYNIVDLGLIYNVEVGEGGTATVTMTTTTPGCPATNYLVEGSRECTSAVDGVTMTEVILTHDPRWSPEKMTDVAKAHFGITD